MSQVLLLVTGTVQLKWLSSVARSAGYGSFISILSLALCFSCGPTETGSGRKCFEIIHLFGNVRFKASLRVIHTGPGATG